MRRRTIIVLSALSVLAFLTWAIARTEVRAVDALKPARRDLQSTQRPQPDRSLPVEVASRSSIPRQKLSETPDPVPEPPALGSIEVTLRLDNGQPVTRAVVELQGGDRRKLEVNSEGQAVFDDLPHGTYWPVVDAESLDAGLAPPGLQRVKSAAQRPGYFRNDVVVSASRPHGSVTLTIVQASALHGYVTDGRGVGLAGVVVRCQASEIGLDAVALDATSDEAGYYTVNRVRPGRYRVQLFVTDESQRSLSRPAPQDFELRAGEVRSMDFALGGGDCEVRGRVVDQDGLGFRELEVLAYFTKAPGSAGPRLTWNNAIARTVTDAKGYYRFDGLQVTEPPVRVAIQVDPYGFEPGREVGANRLGARVEKFVVELVPGSTVNAPTVTAHRSRPFVVEGQIDLPDGVSARGLRVEMTFPARKVAGGLDKNRPLITRKVKVKLRADGSFTWSCETPLSSVTLSVVRGSATYKEVLHPEPEQTLVLSLPCPYLPMKN